MPYPKLDVSIAQQALDVFTMYSGIKAHAARHLGIPVSTLRDRVQCANDYGLTPRTAAPAPVATAQLQTHAPSVATPSVAVIGESDLRERIDGAYRLEKAALALAEGQYIDEVELLRDLRLTGRINRTVLDGERFARFRGRADNGGRVYWGHPASISRLKAEGLLR